MRLSVSQIKTANASLAKWAGQKILGIQDVFESDALPLGNLFEHYLITGKDAYDTFLDKEKIADMEKLLQEYDNLKHNAEGLDIPKGEYQYKIEGELFDVPFIGYADIYTDQCIYDIKTSKYPTDIKKDYPNMRSGLSYYDEYRLQLRAYMKVTGVHKAKIIEIAKHKYKDERNANQIIEIDYTDDLDREMTEKFGPLVEQMKSLYLQHKGS